jgi:hypothetical protein
MDEAVAEARHLLTRTARVGTRLLSPTHWHQPIQIMRADYLMPRDIMSLVRVIRSRPDKAPARTRTSLYDSHKLNDWQSIPRRSAMLRVLMPCTDGGQNPIHLAFLGLTRLSPTGNPAPAQARAWSMYPWISCLTNPVPAEHRALIHLIRGLHRPHGVLRPVHQPCTPINLLSIVAHRTNCSSLISNPKS